MTPPLEHGLRRTTHRPYRTPPWNMDYEEKPTAHTDPPWNMDYEEQPTAHTTPPHIHAPRNCNNPFRVPPLHSDIEGPLRVTCWDHFGDTLGSFWIHFGLILGPCLVHFGVMLGDILGGGGCPPLTLIRKCWVLWYHASTHDQAAA